MKRILLFILIGISSNSFGQEFKRVDLNWKIAPKETLRYYTEIEELDNSEIEIDLDIKADKKEEEKKFTENLFRELKPNNYISKLTNIGNQIIEIELIRGQNKEYKPTSDSTESKEAEFKRMVQYISPKTLLKGSVYENGEIHSFWLDSKSKNLLALLFQLPKDKIKVGDTWSLDINLISYGKNFKCDSSFKLNQVTLTGIELIDGETIATIKYNISEFVTGTFVSNSPIAPNKKQESMMNFNTTATGKFSITQGKWLTYSGLMSLESTGIVKANKKTKYTLRLE